MTGEAISPIGTLGLGGGGTYSSYDSYMNPALMMGMGSMGNPTFGMSPYNMGGIGMMGMMGGMNPEYMKQMMQVQADYQTMSMDLQEQMQKRQLTHAVDMHTLMNQAEVQNMTAHDRSIFEKSMLDGDIQEGIRTLHDVIVSGDSDAICIEYDKLKNTIYTKYNDYFRSNNDKMNSFANVNNLISSLYGKIYTEQNGGVPVDLRSDIKKYGETAFQHGFNTTFLGNSGHNENYSEETISYLFGTRINDKGKKDRAAQYGGYAARGAEGMAAIAAGFGAGIAAKGLFKLLTPSFLSKGLTKASEAAVKNGGVTKGLANAAHYINGWGKWGKIGAVLALGGDILWQMSRD